MKRVIIPLIVTVLIVAAASTFFYVSRQSAIRNAAQAIERADEYWEAGALSFEPRYLEAERAVAGVSDALEVAKLRSCLSFVQLSNETRARIAKGRAGEASKEEREFLTKLRVKAADCIAEEKR